MLPPAQLLPFAARTSDLQLYTGAGVLLGWSFTETTSAAVAELTLTDGTASTFPEYFDITLSSGQSTRDYPPGNGLLIRTGLFFHRVSGTIKGTVWFLPITNVDDRSWAEGDLGVYHVRPGT